MAIHIGFEVVPDAKRLRILLDALVRLNLYELSIRRLPPLYRSGVRYKREPMALGRPERWQTITEVLKRGHGDCEDLASIRVAELRRQGIRAIPWLRKRGNIWHVIVRYPDGRIEDPSKILGMKSE
jgi:hypothetical protein